MAAKYLEDQGYLILERNFRCRSGEIDIVAQDKEYLVFIEVKHRKTASFGTGLEAVDYRKQQQILRVSDFYRVRYRVSDSKPVRYDVISIDGEKNIRHIENAFAYN